MPISPQLLNARLRNSHDLAELRHHAQEHPEVMQAVHDSVICVACGKFGVDFRCRSEAKELHAIATRMWLARPVESFGRESRAAANILHAGAKLAIAPEEDVYQDLLHEAVRLATGFNAQNAANAFWSLATLNIRDADVVLPIAKACVQHTSEFTAQGATNCLWSLATLGINDASITSALSQACADRVKEFNCQDACNSFWAAATLGQVDENVAMTLGKACVDRIKELNTQNAVNALWSCATLGVTDDSIVQPLLKACCERVREFSPQDSANSLWSAALIGVSDESYTNLLSKACATKVRDLKVQELSNALWAVSVLGNTSEDGARPLAQAVSERFRSFIRLDVAQQCLQAHYSGNTLSTEAVAHFHKILLENPKTSSLLFSSHQQQNVAKAIARFGFMPLFDVQLYNGLVTCDILFEIPPREGSEGRPLRIAVEYDGPDHFLRPSFDSTSINAINNLKNSSTNGISTSSSTSSSLSSSSARVGPIDAKTRIRNALIRKLPDIFTLITIPFFEWSSIEFDESKENDYIRTLLENSQVLLK